ncbi:MAG: sugar transferase [Candidatus Omnitrophica bacterium]|nr:sugar transferase [Candidatus Omnitrophota bacterium]
MWRNRRIIFIKSAYILLDIICISLSFVLACWLRKTALPFPIAIHDLGLDYSNPFLIVFTSWLLAILFFNNISGLYQTRRELLESLEIWCVFKAVAYATVVAIVSIYLLKIEGFPRSILVLSVIFINISLSVWRVFKRMFVDFLVVRGYNNFNVLIVGAGKVGVALANEIKKRPGYGLKIVGFLDDFKPSADLQAGHKVVGKLSDFLKIARKEFINKVFITIHHDSKAFLSLLEQAKALHIAVRVVPQGFEFTTGEFSKYNIGFIPVLEYCDEEYSIKQAGKRFFDATMSLILFILLSPVFLIVALMIKLGSPGPVFYFSQRFGRRGKRFNMIKFRSMIYDADKKLDQLKDKNEVDGPIFKMKGDPRVTKLGQWLRKYSLDELPQLINVLKGDMSLVGPRPLPIDQIEREDLRQLRRLEVRPGITGLWQIRGRSDISFSRLVRWDVWYINNWSFWLDINILLQTIPVVVKGKGAY